MRERESEIPTEPHNERPEVAAPETKTEPSPPPVTLESIWDKLCKIDDRLRHLERRQSEVRADLDGMFAFVNSSVRQIKDSDFEDRLAAVELLASRVRHSEHNGSNGG